MEIKAIKNPQSEELVKLLKEKAETPLTPEEKEAQIISWVLGGIGATEEDEKTKHEVRKSLEEIF